MGFHGIPAFFGFQTVIPAFFVIRECYIIHRQRFTNRAVIRPALRIPQAKAGDSRKNVFLRLVFLRPVFLIRLKGICHLQAGFLSLAQHDCIDKRQIL